MLGFALASLGGDTCRGQGVNLSSQPLSSSSFLPAMAGNPRSGVLFDERGDEYEGDASPDDERLIGEGINPVSVECENGEHAVVLMSA